MTGTPPASHLPLDGLVVADFTRVLAGPYCTLLLADLGAEVIKVERPGVGDDTRAWGPPFRGPDATYFLGLNRDKKSVALDLAVDEDRRLAQALAQEADIVVENFTEGVMERYGLDYDTVRARNPAVVYCSINAYLGRGDTPGYDLLLQAAAGFMSITGPAHGPPTKLGVALLDVLCGLHASTAIVAAVAQRHRSGAGRRVRVGLFESSVAALVNQAYTYLMGGEVPTRLGNQHPSIVPYESFEGADGTFVVAAGNDKLYQALCSALDRPDLAGDERFRDNRSRVEHRQELIDQLQAIFSTRPVDHWVARLAAAAVPAAAVRGIDEVFESPEGRGTLLSIPDPGRGTLEMVASPFALAEGGTRQHRPPPRLGEHTAEVRDRFLAPATETNKDGTDDPSD